MWLLTWLIAGSAGAAAPDEAPDGALEVPAEVPQEIDPDTRDRLVVYGIIGPDVRTSTYVPAHLGANVVWAVAPGFAVELAGGTWFGARRSRWQPLTQLIPVTGEALKPVSRPQVAADLRVNFAVAGGLIGSDAHRAPMQLNALAGFGLVGTLDDETALQCSGAPLDPCTLTLQQVHPTTVLGGALWLGVSRRARIRVAMEHRAYIEVLNGTALELHQSVVASVGIGVVAR